MNVTSTRDLFTRIGALYVALVEQEEAYGQLQDELKQSKEINSRMSEKLGNALAHLERYNKEVHDRIMQGETVPVEAPDLEPPPAGPSK